MDRRQSNTKEKNADTLATFEEAIRATHYGKFNIMLIAVAIPGCLCAVFETTTMAYVFSPAQCDLSLTLEHKGLLNSITYAGMISSALIWGFLCDVLGRKKLMTIGFLTHGICVFISAFSQNLLMLMITKFIGGFIITGPFAALSSYLSEFHRSNLRPMTQMILGTINASGNLILAILGWIILPRVIEINLFDDAIRLHSWNFYIMVTSFFSLFCGICFIFLPESPKFLMTCGENEKALKVFQKVFSINTGKPKTDFPYKHLIDETTIGDKRNGGYVTAHRTNIQALKEGFMQIKPLFFKPYLSKLFVIGTIAISIMMSNNTLRLWFPDIFQAAENYALTHNGTTSTLCVMLSELQPHRVSENVTECFTNMDNDSVYINSIINGSVTVAFLICSGIVIRFTGKKLLLIIVTFTGSVFSCALYFSPNTLTTTIITSVITSTGSSATSIMTSVCVEMFPTTLRTLTVSFAMMVGRIGSMAGNLIFPILLGYGCAPPFFVFGFITGISFILALTLPNLENKALQ